MTTEKARRALQDKFAAGLTKKNPIERLNEKPTSMRRAINAKCYDCVGGDGDQGWRQRVRKCFDNKCPLYNFRPFKQENQKP